MPVTGASIGNHIAENRESVQRDRPLPSSVGASSIIKIESEPLLDAYSHSSQTSRQVRKVPKAEVNRHAITCTTVNDIVQSLLDEVFDLS
jgi:hypothetical protein